MWMAPAGKAGDSHGLRKDTSKGAAAQLRTAAAAAATATATATFIAQFCRWQCMSLDISMGRHVGHIQ